MWRKVAQLLGKVYHALTDRKDSSMLFAECLANPEMARDLISGYKLKPSDPGGKDFVRSFDWRDDAMRELIAAVSSLWRVAIGVQLSFRSIGTQDYEKIFLDFLGKSGLPESASVLRGMQEQPEHDWLFWRRIDRAKIVSASSHPNECVQLIKQEPRQYKKVDGELLLDAIRAQHRCALPISAEFPHLAVNASRIAPEHARQIAKTVPAKAVQIAAAVPEAFR